MVVDVTCRSGKEENTVVIISIFGSTCTTHKEFVITVNRFAAEPKMITDVLAPLKKDGTPLTLACLKKKRNKERKKKIIIKSGIIYEIQIISYVLL